MTEAARRGYPSKHGAALGRELARLAESQAQNHPYLRRCADCAFREGTVPNMMAGTLMDAMHCVLRIDPSPFACHHDLEASGKPTHLCAGYLLCRAAPREDVKAAMFRAHEALAEFQGREDADLKDEAFAAWKVEHDPEGKLDNYEMARQYTRYRAKRVSP